MASLLKKFSAGEMIFKEGETGHKIYIIKQGAVRIVAQKEDKSVTLGVLKSGACFGEMAVISSAPRVASAVADTASEVYEIDKKQVDKMISELPPLFRAIVASLIKRVTTLNNYAAETSSVVHPLIALANLIALLHQSQTVNTPASPNTSNMGLRMSVPTEAVEEKDQEDSIPLSTIIQASHSILGNTKHNTEKLLERFVQLKLAQIGMRSRKKQFTFRPARLVSDTQDLLNALGKNIDNELSAELEYIDLTELAQQMNMKPFALLETIATGKISIDAVVLKQSIVKRSIEAQGRQLF